jgi:hypothetical protein
MNEGAGTIRPLDLTARRWRIAALIQIDSISGWPWRPDLRTRAAPQFGEFSDLRSMGCTHECREQES